jgi:hypothetical protein
MEIAMTGANRPGHGRDVDAKLDRRRPGRIENASPELIMLMRHPVPPGNEAALLADIPATELSELVREPGAFDMAAERDNLAAAKGVMTGIVFSLVFWLGCFLVMRLLVPG